MFQRELVSPLIWTEERSWNLLVEDSLSTELVDVMEKIFRKMRRIFYRKGGRNVRELRILKAMDPERDKYDNKESELSHQYLIDLFRPIAGGDDESSDTSDVQPMP